MNWRRFRTLSHSSRRGVNLRVSLGDEFVSRDDGWVGLTDAYGMSEECIMEFNEQAVVVEAGDTYEQLEHDEADVVMGFSTDPELMSDDYVVLTDDREFFPVYNPVVVVYKPLLESPPEIEPLLNDLAEGLDSVETMQRLIGRVTNEGVDPQTVAREYLAEVS